MHRCCTYLLETHDTVWSEEEHRLQLYLVCVLINAFAELMGFAVGWVR